MAHLSLSNNNIKDISFLLKLTNLRILNLQQRGLTNLDILKRQNFKHLEKLSIGMNNINNYSFLENLTNL